MLYQVQTTRHHSSTMQCLKATPQIRSSAAVGRTFVCCQNARPTRSRFTPNEQRCIWVVPHASSTEQQETRVVQVPIYNLDTNYCDSFECKSSPAVEQTVRSLAGSITKFKWNTSNFQPDVQYQDGFRKFKGSDKYRAAFWPREALKHPKASITKMAMLDNGKAQIDWLLAGQLAAFNVSIPMTSVFELNLVTGRVTSHTDSWDLSKLPLPAAAAATGSRMIWSAKAASKAAGDSISKGVTDSLNTLTSMDDDDDEYYMNPNDPTRFFQKGDNGMNDAVMLAMGVAGLYLVFKVFESLETLP